VQFNFIINPVVSVLWVQAVASMPDNVLDLMMFIVIIYSLLLFLVTVVVVVVCYPCCCCSDIIY